MDRRNYQPHEFDMYDNNSYRTDVNMIMRAQS